jgi:hypothetical protein
MPGIHRAFTANCETLFVVHGVARTDLAIGRTPLEIEVPGRTSRVQTLAAGDRIGWSSILMGCDMRFQTRALGSTDARPHPNCRVALQAMNDD